MWQANVTDESRLVAVGGHCSEDSAPIPTLNSTPTLIHGTPESTSAPTSGSSSNPSTNSSAIVTTTAAATPPKTNGMPTVVLVAAILGGACGSFVIVVLAFCIIRRKRANKAMRARAQPMANQGAFYDAKHGPPEYELEDRQRTVELSTSGERQELGGIIRPSELMDHKAQ